MDRRTHRAFESTRSKTCGDYKLSLNMSRREVSGSIAPSRWQRVKRDKRAVLCALRGSINSIVRTNVRETSSSYVADHAFRRNGLVSIPAESNALGRMAKRDATQGGG